MIKKVLDIVKEKIIVVRPINPIQLDKVNDRGWKEIYAHTFPSKMVVVSMYHYSQNKQVSLEYFFKNKVNHINVPETFEVELLSKGKMIIDKYVKHRLKNLKDDEHFEYFNGNIGSDPEIFVENKKGGLIPAFTFLGSKKSPTKTSKGYQAYWDGFQAEFTTEAVDCLAYHVDSIQDGLRTVIDSARKVDPDARLSIKTIFNIPPKLLLESQQQHVAFGCMPSLNAYGMAGLKKDGRKVNYRSAGGHIHFGMKDTEGDKYTEETAGPVVKALDAILGVACISLFAKFDDPKRRKLYGIAGEYRLPKHGIEYRVLSNAWLSHPLITHLVFDLARRAVMLQQRGLFKHWKHDEKTTINTIQKCDVKAARDSLKKNKALFISLFETVHHNKKEAEMIYRIFLGGMERVVKNPADLVTNWDLDDEWANHSANDDKCWENAVYNIKKRKKVA